MMRFIAHSCYMGHVHVGLYNACEPLHRSENVSDKLCIPHSLM